MWQVWLWQFIKKCLFRLCKSLSCIVLLKGAAKSGPSENNKEKVTILYHQGTEVYHEPKIITMQRKQESTHSCVLAAFATLKKQSLTGLKSCPKFCFLWKRWHPKALLRNFNYVLKEAGDRALWECQATLWRDERLAFNVIGDLR